MTERRTPLYDFHLRSARNVVKDADLDELKSPADQAGVLWEYLLQKGREFDLRPYRVEAMQSLRIEKSLPLYGPDVSEEDTPFHVGLSRWVRLDKRDFIGREALLRVQEPGLERRWVGLTLQSEVPATGGTRVYSLGDVATFREVNLIVEINGRPIPARVAPTPFFDPENTRLRSEPYEDEHRREPTARSGVSVNSRSSAAARQSTNGGAGS